MSTILIRQGRIIDPVSETEKTADLLIRDGVIAEISESIDETADRVIDAKGLTVTPGIVDMHVHFRDPGQNYKEDIFTGAMAAAHGGVTSVLAMPNTRPVMDEPDRIRNRTVAEHTGFEPVKLELIEPVSDDDGTKIWFAVRHERDMIIETESQ